MSSITNRTSLLSLEKQCGGLDVGSRPTPLCVCVIINNGKKEELGV